MSTPVPLDIRGPITRAEAEAAGLSASGIRRHLVALVRGVYVPTGTIVTERLLALAALKRSPAGAALSHHSAARAWSAVVPPAASVHVTVIGSSRPQVHGIVHHRSRRTDGLLEHDGVRLTSPERTFTDMSAVLDVVDLVVLGDSLVTRAVTTPELLVEAARSWSGSGAPRARHAASLVRLGADEPWQTRLRVHLVLAGLPQPVMWLPDADDRRVLGREPFLAYPKARLALRSRRAAGPARPGSAWVVLAVDEEDVQRRPEAVLTRIVTVLGREASRRPAPRSAEQP